MKRIFDYKQYLINESNGYGEEDFYVSEDGDQTNYFFKLEDTEQRAFVLSIGKFSKYTNPAEAKNSYGVLSLTELTEDALDQAVIDEGAFDTNERLVDVDQDVLDRLLGTVTKAVEQYLQDEPKVNRFYDELQDKIKYKGYNEALSVAISDWPGEWVMQEVEKGKLNLITK